MSSRIRPFIRRTLLVPALVLAAALVAACGKDTNNNPTGPGGTEATLQVINVSNNAVLLIRARACGTSTWGSDLPGAEVLTKGETMTRTFTPGCIDLRLTPAELGADYLYFTNVQLLPGSTKALTVTAFPAE